MWGWAPVVKKWFPHLLQPVIGDTDLQFLADFRTGFPFSVTNEVGDLVGQPNGRRFPDYLTVNVALERRFPFRGYLWAGGVSLINALGQSERGEQRLRFTAVPDVRPRAGASHECAAALSGAQIEAYFFTWPRTALTRVCRRLL